MIFSPLSKAQGLAEGLILKKKSQHLTTSKEKKIQCRRSCGVAFRNVHLSMSAGKNVLLLKYCFFV